MGQIFDLILISTIAVVIGFIADLIVGDPHFLLHPVVIIGKIISFLETITRKIFKKTKNGERVGGFVTVFSTIIIATLIPLAILYFAYILSPILYFILESVMCMQILATKSLRIESEKVYFALESGDIKKARFALSMIVGRDTDHLNPSEIAKGAVETVAENTSDGVVAPLIFLLIGGAPLGFLYKAINTLDSMIGYKNEKYRFFGTVGARLDDFVNYIPSRISALIMVFACKFVKLDGKNAMKIWKRDRRCHESPNSAQTESAAAGALNIQLAGDAVYGGVKKLKQKIGDANREINNDDIRKTNKLMYATAFLSLIIFCSVKAMILYLIS